jgi:hypothetical protein
MRRRAAFAKERYPSLAVRRDRLARLLDFVTRHEARFVAAVDRDFGGRSSHETRLAELYIVAAEIAEARKHLARWMRPQRVATPHPPQARTRAHRAAARRRRRASSARGIIPCSWRSRRSRCASPPAIACC